MTVIETALAAWRLAYMLVHEDGPFAVFAHLRHRAGVRAIVTRDAAGKPASSRAALTPMAEALTCVWCVSVWAAALLSLPGMGWLRRVLAVAAGAVLVHESVKKLR